MTSLSNSRVNSGPVHVKFVKEKVAIGQFLLRLLQFPRQYHSTMLHTHTTVIRKTSGRSMGTSNKELFFRISRSTG